MNKRNKTLLIVSLVFIVLAITFLVLGFTLAGEDVLGWFTSTYAYIIYTVLGVYLILLLYIIVGDWIKKL